MSECEDRHSIAVRFVFLGEVSGDISIFCSKTKSYELGSRSALRRLHKENLTSEAMNRTLFIVAITATCIAIACGEGGSFPKTENIGRHKPVETVGEKTCGHVYSSLSYCEPATDKHGLAKGACDRKPCSLECPGRDRNIDGVVPSIDVMNGNLGNCIIKDNDDNRGTNMVAYRFLNHPACFSQPMEVLEIGRSPSRFTLAVWIKQEYGNAG